jgi:hypothetical protein
LAAQFVINGLAFLTRCLLALRLEVVPFVAVQIGLQN